MACSGCKKNTSDSFNWSDVMGNICFVESGDAEKLSNSHPTHIHTTQECNAHLFYQLAGNGLNDFPCET